MPSGEEVLKNSPKFTILLTGPFSSGKTRDALTFPKCYVCSCDPAGIDILYEKENEEIRKNLIWYEVFRNSSQADLKQIFKQNAKSSELSSIYGCLEHAKELAAKGTIETFVLDGATYLVDMKWQEIVEDLDADKLLQEQQKLYRELSLWAQRFFPSYILPLATRHNLNVIVTCHLKRETQEAVKGTDKNPRLARKLSSESDVAPAIEGSYRNKIEGQFGAHIYLENKLTPTGAIKFNAYCEKTVGFGTVVLAGNNYGLPAILDITGKSFYEVLKQSVNTNKAPEGATN